MTDTTTSPSVSIDGRSRWVAGAVEPIVRATRLPEFYYTDPDLYDIEEQHACRAVQVGLRSRMHGPGSLAPLELPIWQFQRWLVNLLQDVPTESS